jgi:hypothetical protein
MRIRTSVVWLTLKSEENSDYITIKIGGYPSYLETNCNWRMSIIVGGITSGERRKMLNSKKTTEKAGTKYDSFVNFNQQEAFHQKVYMVELLNLMEPVLYEFFHLYHNVIHDMDKTIHHNHLHH